MHIHSPAFADGAPIPERFTCDGADVSPELRFDVDVAAQPDTAAIQVSGCSQNVMCAASISTIDQVEWHIDLVEWSANAALVLHITSWIGIY